MNELTQQEEHGIIDRCMKGDDEAYAVLVDRYKVLAYTLAFRMLGDADCANDVAQDGFLAAYEGLARFRRTSKFSTWLATIILNKCRDRLRSRRETVPVEDIAEIRSCGTQDPEALANENERSAALQQALGVLSPEDREVIVLKHLEELAYEEIAAITGSTVPALKVRTHRAREKLKEALEKQGVMP